MKRSWKIAPLALFILILGIPSSRADQAPSSAAGPSDLSEKVRHELVMLPFYSVYDDLNYEVNGDTVTLTGAVTRPTLKSDAEAVVKRIPGVNRVDNQIALLPLSDWDNQVRRMVYVTLFNSGSPLFRYGLGADPSIHILVDNGHVTLKGTVASQADKNIANLYVQGLFGVLSVTNDLNVS
jgi:osmotically-inducible protein OsmY